MKPLEYEQKIKGEINMGSKEDLKRKEEEEEEETEKEIKRIREEALREIREKNKNNKIFKYCQ